MLDDKEPVFEAADTLALTVPAMTGMVQDMVFDRAAMAAAAGAGHATATDLADWLVRARGLPFREAHHLAGQAVRLADAKACTLAELALEDLRALSPEFGPEVFQVLTVEASVASRASEGGTAPRNVRAAARAMRRRLG